MVATTTGRATDFITFTRTSNATVTGADGKIKWAGHNLLTNSESFDASAWLKINTASTNPAVTANAAAAPNSTTTADRVDFGVIDAAADYSIIYQQQTVVAGTHTAAFWVKAFAAGDVGKKLWAFIYNNTTKGLQTVTLTADWQYITMSGSMDAGAAQLQIGTFGSSAVTGGENQAAVSVLLWGAHLYRSDLGGMVLNPARGDAYYPTTPRNLLGFTEDFSNAAWTKSATTITANAVLAPNGLQTADTLLDTAATSSHYIYQSVASATVSGTNYTVRFYAKANTLNYVAAGIADISNGSLYATAVFNLATGSLATSGAVGTGYAIVGTPSINAVGDGWYLCSVTCTPGSSKSFLTVAIGANKTGVISAGSGGMENYLGNGSGIYLWGAQLSDSASLDAYSPVYGAAVTSAAYYAPRLDYDANGSALGLLVEEQRTNVLLHTAAFDVSATWSPSASGTGVSPVVTANYGLAPDGTMTADRVQLDSGAAGLSQLAQEPGTFVSTSHTFSIWLRSLSGSVTVTLFALSDVLNVTVTTSWQRFTFPRTISSSTPVSVRIAKRDAWSSSGSADLLVWGAQLEAGSFATSYIPNGSAVAGATRTADVASVSTQAFPYSSTAGTVVANFNTISTQSTLSRAVWQLTESVNNRILVMYNPNSVLLRHLAFVGGSAVGVVDYNVTPPTKDAFAYKADDFAGSANGASVTSDPSGAVPTPATQLAIGRNDVSSSDYLNGWIRQITYIPRRLSNAELQSRSV